MQKNKFTTYLLYAIGEIVLVVIGILIAVSINNWNQDRKNAALTKSYLESLKEDFILNDSISTHLIAYNTFQASNARLLLDCFENGVKEEDYQAFYFAFHHVYFINHVKFESETWKELISTGNLTLIEHKGLIEQLKKYYAEVEKYYEIEGEWTQNNTKLREIHSTVAPMAKDDHYRTMSTIGLTKILQDTTGFSDPTPYINQLATINEEWFFLRSVEVSRTYPGIQTQESLRSSAQIILRSINNELKFFD